MRPAANSQNETFLAQLNKRLSGLSDLIDGCFSYWRNIFQYHKDMQRLRNMPDYLLRDMGIERSDVDATSFIALLFRTGSHH